MTATTLVLGAGLSGLAAARALQARGQACTVLERAPTVGGLTRTVNLGDYCFDYTGHFLHLAHYGTPSGVPFAGLDDADWQTIDRESRCFVGGALVPAPIQYRLGHLPAAERDKCIAAYEARPRDPVPPTASFREYLVAGFGQHLADLFLIPQNEKTMATSLGRLSRDAVRRFFPAPDDALIRAGFTPSPAAAPAPAGSAGYNARFWYPRTGGIGALVDGLRSGLADLRVNSEVTALDLRKRELRTRDGARFHWDRLYSSLPLKWLGAMTDDADLRDAASRLTHSATVSFNLGLKTPLPDRFRGLHWIYVPDRSLPFYRVGFYSEISPGTAATGTSSMYVEVGVPSEQLATLDIAGDLQPRVLAALESLSWLDRRQVAVLAVHVIECAYVHHTPEREAAVAGMVARLGQHGIVPIGRYGLWDYTSMEDSIRSGIAAVEAHP